MLISERLPQTTQTSCGLSLTKSHSAQKTAFSSATAFKVGKLGHSHFEGFIPGPWAEVLQRNALPHIAWSENGRSGCDPCSVLTQESLIRILSFFFRGLPNAPRAQLFETTGFGDESAPVPLSFGFSEQCGRRPGYPDQTTRFHCCCLCLQDISSWDAQGSSGG